MDKQKRAIARVNKIKQAAITEDQQKLWSDSEDTNDFSKKLREQGLVFDAFNREFAPEKEAKRKRASMDKQARRKRASSIAYSSDNPYHITGDPEAEATAIDLIETKPMSKLLDMVSGDTIEHSLPDSLTDDQAFEVGEIINSVADGFASVKAASRKRARMDRQARANRIAAAKKKEARLHNMELAIVKLAKVITEMQKKAEAETIGSPATKDGAAIETTQDNDATVPSVDKQPTTQEEASSVEADGTGVVTSEPVTSSAKPIKMAHVQAMSFDDTLF